MSPRASIRQRRIPFSRSVVIVARSGEVTQEQTVDLSMGGLFVQTQFPLGVGEKVDVELEFAPFKLRTAAVVAWTRLLGNGLDEAESRAVSGMALRFKNLNRAQKKMIYREVASHLKRGGRLLVGRVPAPRAAAARAGSGRAPGKGSGSWLSRLWRSG